MTDNTKGTTQRTLIEVLEDYARLPEYLGEPSPGVNSRSLFGDFPVSIATVRGSIDDLQTLLQAGADINQAGEDGFTPLHYAALHGHLDMVRYLMAAGASPGVRNFDGMTPLDVAAACGEKKKIIDALNN